MCSYAFIEVALYGKAYVPAAKDAWVRMRLLIYTVTPTLNSCLL